MNLNTPCTRVSALLSGPEQHGNLRVFYLALYHMCRWGMPVLLHCPFLSSPDRPLSFHRIRDEFLDGPREISPVFLLSSRRKGISETVSVWWLIDHRTRLGICLRPTGVTPIMYIISLLLLSSLIFLQPMADLDRSIFIVLDLRIPPLLSRSADCCS